MLTYAFESTSKLDFYVNLMWGGNKRDQERWNKKKDDIEKEIKKREEKKKTESQDGGNKQKDERMKKINKSIFMNSI